MDNFIDPKDRFSKPSSVWTEKTVEQFNECQSILDADTKWFVIGDRIRKEIKQPTGKKYSKKMAREMSLKMWKKCYFTLSESL